MKYTVILVYVIFCLLLGLFFLAIPVVYTILRLQNQIGPEDTANAKILGIVLWAIGLMGLALLWEIADGIINKLLKTPPLNQLVSSEKTVDKNEKEKEEM